MASLMHTGRLRPWLTHWSSSPCLAHTGALLSPCHPVPSMFQNPLLHRPWWSNFSPVIYPTFSNENQ